MFMKQALKSKKVYIISGVLLFLGLLPFIIAIIIYYASSPQACFEGYPWVIWGLLSFYFLIGFIWGDLHVATYRKKQKNYDGALPDEIKSSAWKRRLPFWFASGGLLILAIILEIYCAIMAIYPFII